MVTPFLQKDVDGNKIEKSLDEYNDEEKKEFQLNSKLMCILACAMDRTEFNIICQCKTAKEVLDMTPQFPGVPLTIRQTAEYS